MKIREMVIYNREGKRMPATLRVPEGEVRGTMLLLHGLGGWKDQLVITSVAEEVCIASYTVLTFNSSDSPFGPDGKFFDNTNTGYVEDVEDVCRWMHAQEWYQGPLVIAGHSQGGLAALHYVSQNPGVAARLVLMAPAVAWYSGLWMYWPLAAMWLVRGSSMWPGPIVLAPLGRKWLFDFLKFDGYKDARSVTIPVLIVSAQKDKTVGKPFIHRNLARHFKNAAWKMVEGAGHSFSDPARAKELAGIVGQWLTS